MSISLIKPMYLLSEAVRHLGENSGIYAFDSKRKDGGVGKAFLCLSKEGFEKVLESNMYGWHFYEVLLPTRPTRIFIDIETENGVYETVKKGVLKFVDMLQQFCEFRTGDKDAFTVLDSSSDAKCSFHVVGGPYFKNPYHVGALVRRLTCYVNVSRDSMGCLFDNDGKYIVDEAIYTQNRQFRLAEMNKLGSTRVLRGCTWRESMLQNVRAASPLICLEIDESEPVSTSYGAMDMFTSIDGVWHRIRGGSSRSTLSTTLPDSLRPVIRFVENQVDGSVSNAQFNVSTGCYMLSCSSKQCKIAGRVHRGNHVWLVLNPWKRTIVQKCFDDECRKKEYVYDIPIGHWEKWVGITRQEVDISRCD